MLNPGVDVGGIGDCVFVENAGQQKPVASSCPLCATFSRQQLFRHELTSAVQRQGDFSGHAVCLSRNLDDSNVS